MSACQTCGGPVAPHDSFCQSCGAPVVQAAPAPDPAPYPQPQTRQQPAAYPAPTTAPQPPTRPYPAPAQQSYPPPGPQPRPQPSPAPARKGLSGAAILGIVAAALLTLGALGAGGFFALRALTPMPQAPETTPPPATAESEPVDPGVSPVPSDASATPETATDAQAADAENQAAPGSDDGIVTDEQARRVVAAFEDARIAKDTGRARSLCSKAFLGGEWKDALKDPTWRPDSYEIVSTSPDLMYVHVVVSERWPSGDEYWIYSVFVDPSTGEPAIDGTLDPEYVPELLPE